MREYGATIYFKNRADIDTLNFYAEPQASIFHIYQAIGEYYCETMFDIEDIEIKMTKWGHRVAELNITKDSWEKI